MSFFDSHTVVHLDPKEYPIYKQSCVKILPENLMLTSNRVPFLEPTYKFNFQPGDTIVQGFPKSGTMWVQEILWTMIKNPNLNNPKANGDIDFRVPTLDNIYGHTLFPKTIRSAIDSNTLCEHFPGMDVDKTSTWREAMNYCPRPRIFKVHMPATFFNNTFLDSTKIVQIIRDPRDTLVSAWHYYSKTISQKLFEGNLETFMDNSINGKGLFGDIANYIQNLLYYKNHPNFLLIFYENLKENTFAELKKLNDFLKTNLVDDQLKKIEKYVSFDEMKKRDLQPLMKYILFDVDSCKEQGGHLRKGRVGSFREELSPEMQDRIKSYMETSFKGLDLPY